MTSWSVYLLECADKTLYCGCTTDLERRVKEHNSPDKAAKYTRGRQPVHMVWYKSGFSRSQALKEELRIKSLHKSEKLALIATG